jgi:hypothetical protein
VSGEEIEIPDLMVLSRQAVAHHAMRRLLGPESLPALDLEPLFYLTWRRAPSTSAIPAGEVYKPSARLLRSKYATPPTARATARDPISLARTPLDGP